MQNESIYTHIADSINSAVTRRKFMQLSAVGAGSILGGSVLAQLQAIAAPPVAADEGILVMIYLAGGCDPLNTFVPFTDNTYRNSRPTISLSPEGQGNRRCIPVSDAYGFNAALPTVAQMYLDGKAAVLPGIGFGDQTMSHFASIETYMRGWGGITGAPSGWIGRYLDSLSNPEQNSTRGITINGTMPLVLQGALSQPTALPSNINSAYLATKDDLAKNCGASLGSFADYGAPVKNLIASSLKNAITIPDNYRPAYPTTGAYSGRSAIENNMQITAGVINANVGARVIHVTHGGYDTHTNEVNSHAITFAELDAAIKVFFESLDPAFADRVTLMTYSEFGRRLGENSGGTDHGRASMAMLIGNKVAGGQVLSALPDLAGTDNSGNVVETTDFRQVYADIATNWLKGDPDLVVGKSFPSLGIFKGGPGTSSSNTTTTQKPTTTTRPPSTQPPSTSQPPMTTNPPMTQPPMTSPPMTNPPMTTTTKPVTTTTRPVTTTTKPVTTTTRPVTTTTKAPTVPDIEPDWVKLIKFLLRLSRRHRRW